MNMRPRTVALIGALLLLAAACGSTAQIGAGTPAAAGGTLEQPLAAEQHGDAGLGLDVGSQDPAGAPPAAGGPPLGPSPAPGGPGSPPAATAVGPAAAGTEQDAGPTPATPGSGSQTAERGDRFAAAPGAPGITDTQLYLGMSYTENANAGNEALGYGEITKGDQLRYHEIMVAHINASGGIAGREVVPVFDVVDGTSNQTIAEREQQACSTWTQDNEVFAVVVGAATDTLRQCLSAAGVGVVVVQGFSMSDDKTFADFPHAVEPTNLSLNVVARLTVDALAARDFFAPTGPAAPTKVGVITYDYPPFMRAMEQDMLPALEALGLDVADPVYVKWTDRQSDAGELSAQLSSTVLRFSSEGVTHVLPLDLSGLMTVLLLSSAESQGYRPQYGFNSQNGGQLLVGVVPEAQLHGAEQAGWMPLLDTPDVPEWPAKQACEGIYEAEDVHFDSTNAAAVGLVICDMHLLMRAGIENAPGPLQLTSLIGGFERLGTSYASPLVPDVRLEPGRRYGVATYRTSAFSSECTCFTYTGGPVAIR